MEEEQAVADLAATLPQVDGAGDSDTDSDNQEDFQPALQEQVLRCVLWCKHIDNYLDILPGLIELRYFIVK